jgi:hypothetical protein
MTLRQFHYFALLLNVLEQEVKVVIDRLRAGDYASNAMFANGNMDIYVAAKAALVAQLLTRARAERGLPPVLYWTPEELTTQ